MDVVLLELDAFSLQEVFRGVGEPIVVVAAVVLSGMPPNKNVDYHNKGIKQLTVMNSSYKYVYYC